MGKTDHKIYFGVYIFLNKSILIEKALWMNTKKTKKKKKNEENLLKNTKLAFIYLSNADPQGHSE